MTPEEQIEKIKAKIEQKRNELEGSCATGRKTLNEMIDNYIEQIKKLRDENKSINN